jgi:hypothetical protein
LYDFNGFVGHDSSLPCQSKTIGDKPDERIGRIIFYPEKTNTAWLRFGTVVVEFLPQDGSQILQVINW